MTLPSHLVALFTAQAWMLHQPVYDSLSDMLDAHLRGALAKDAWRTATAPVALGWSDDEPEPVDETAADEIHDGIALIEVRGVLAMRADQVNGACQPQGRSYQKISDQLAAANADPRVRAIVLRLQTPGGSALGCQEVYDQIITSAKPVHAWIDGYCFSAGYFLASACESVVASSVAADVGSIGVYMATWDTSAASEKNGARRVVVRCGQYKALGSLGEKIDDAALAEMQREVDGLGACFHDAVRAGRGLDDEQAAQVCNGRTFLAAEAQALGLIDGIASLPELLAGLVAGLTTEHKEPRMFGTKKPAATPTATDGLSKADYATLAARFPDAQDQLAALDAEGLSKAEIEASLWQSQAERWAATAGQQAEALASQAAAHAEALAAKDADIAALQADLAAARDLVASRATAADPGSDLAAEAALGEPLSDARLAQEWAALSPARQTEYVSLAGYTYCRRNGLGPAA